MEVKLVVVGGKQSGTEIPIRAPKFLIGRGEECQLRPQSHLISRKHCAISIVEGQAAIEDFGSTNGTFVNGEKLEQPRTLRDGDRIKVGMFELEFRVRRDAAEAKKPKVHSVEEAVVRTTVSAVARDDDMDISGWLAEENEKPPAATPSKQSVTDDSVGLTHDTIVGKPTDETTTTMPTADAPPKKEKPKKETKPAVKMPGHFKQPPKPIAESSRSAAEDMLRQFFPRKK
jgi:pSer/pThr/pTyr-binding forkhead associated (FHA) protein